MAALPGRAGEEGKEMSNTIPIPYLSWLCVAVVEVEFEGDVYILNVRAQLRLVNH